MTLHHAHQLKQAIRAQQASGTLSEKAPCVVESCVTAWKLWSTCLLMRNGLYNVVATPEASGIRASKVSQASRTL